MCCPPGEHRLTIRVDNRLQLPAQGHLVDSHSVSDSLGAAWNGIVGRIELQSTAPPVWIDGRCFQIFPDAKNKSIRVKMMLHNSSGQASLSGKFEFNVESCPGTEPIDLTPVSENFNNLLDTNFAEEAIIHLGNQAQLWDEFSPVLYRLRIEVHGGTGKLLFNSETTNIFALREITASDKNILINGRPVNLRLTHFGGDFPLTGYPAMDVGSWKKIIQACKDYGLNGIRFHSWCPPDAAFAAADEMGFYLQPECGLWADFGSPTMRQWLNDETARILAAYGNHPRSSCFRPAMNPAITRTSRHSGRPPIMPTTTAGSIAPQPVGRTRRKSTPAHNMPRSFALATASYATPPAGLATIIATLLRPSTSPCLRTRSARGAPILISM